MESRTFYNEVLTEHNIHPTHKIKLMKPASELRGVNPSCGDDITLQLVVNEDGIIEDGGFTGDGCAISQASADMMLDLVIGKPKEEALKLKDTFLRMIKEKLTEEELDTLEEAQALQDISHMPSRVKCAVLGWHTLDEILNGNGKESVSTEDQ
jgi:SUF system FeS assembly protein, NifU family